MNDEDAMIRRLVGACRRVGLSYPLIAYVIAEVFGRAVSAETVRRWHAQEARG